ncbi:12238_t:CDS:2, partial [Dentiscutata heterogama]
IGPMLENESFTVLNIRPSFDDNQIVWDRLILNEHLKRSGFDSDWKELNPSECIITDSLPYAPYGYGIGENDKFLLTDLNDSDLKYYLGIEPWAIHPAERILDTYVKPRLQFPRYVIYLETERKVRLLIGNNTIQVWRGKKLEFIRIVNEESDAPEEPYEKFKVNKIRYENASANDSEKSKLKNTISKYSSKTLKKNEKERPLHSWQVPLKDILPDI